MHRFVEPELKPEPIRSAHVPPRRSQRIYQAQRYGILRRLVNGERVNDLHAEHWIARLVREAEAAARPASEATYWDDAWRWIEAERSRV